jgi:hypothetical protein
LFFIVFSTLDSISFFCFSNDDSALILGVVGFDSTPETKAQLRLDISSLDVSFKVCLYLHLIASWRARFLAGIVSPQYLQFIGRHPLLARCRARCCLGVLRPQSGQLVFVRVRILFFFGRLVRDSIGSREKLFFHKFDIGYNLRSKDIFF